MTIKQQGGIFGRNPTFNDVDVEGTLTVDGNAVPDAGTILVDSDIGVTVQGYDADTAKRDTAQTFTAKQDFIFAGGGNYVAQFQNTTAATPYAVSIKDAASSSNGYPLFIITNSAGSDTYFRVDSGTSDITAGKNIRFLSSGLGIDFSATSGTGTSELFDDYEEGTWTPAINGTADTTYSTQYGWYTKVGNLVSVGFELTVNTEGTITGNAIIAGLPFTSGASDSKSSGSLSYSGSSGFSSVWQGIVIGNNQSLISIFVKSAASGSTTSLNGSDFFANGTSIIGQLTYKV